MLSSASTSARFPTHQLPDRLIVGYANWNECDEKIVQAVRDGVNVVIWFATNLAVSPAGEPIVTSGPDMDCVADRIKEIRDLGLSTANLISIGGWNSPHPDTSNPVEVVFEAWNNWNRNIAARPDKGFYGFDGFDWDIEGNDTPSNPYNMFTVECLDLMGRFSQLAKQAGYIVSMAPAESYLDPTTSMFDRSLLHEYEEWKTIQPGFAYHGHNTYAYLLDKYGLYEPLKSTIPQTQTGGGTVSVETVESESTTAGTASVQNLPELLPTFDFVTIQLYEGYSHAEYNITQQKQSPVEYLTNFVKRVVSGWNVDFSTDIELKYNKISRISVDKTRLVIGLANGWAGDGKFLLIYPEMVDEAYSTLVTTNEQPRGFAFWNILDEGRASERAPNVPVWMAAGLNRFMKIRDSVGEGKDKGDNEDGKNE